MRFISPDQFIPRSHIEHIIYIRLYRPTVRLRHGIYFSHRIDRKRAFKKLFFRLGQLNKPSWKEYERYISQLQYICIRFSGCIHAACSDNRHNSFFTNLTQGGYRTFRNGTVITQQRIIQIQSHQFYLIHDSVAVFLLCAAQKESRPDYRLLYSVLSQHTVNHRKIPQPAYRF